MMSKESLLKLARNQHYKPEILEKVLKLLQVLQQIMAVPYLRERFVLKGGTALNLFQFDNVPRLSVDIDLNYIGALDRNVMLEERIVINDAIQKILEQNKFEHYRSPGHHAGGKMVWRYASVLGQKGNLEIDINYMYRQPLLAIEWKQPKLSIEKPFETPVLDIHELAAGKLSALFSRRTSRDLFDAHHLLTQCGLQPDKLRFAFVVYLAMTEIDMAYLTSNSVSYDLLDIHNQLLPLLHQAKFPRSKRELKIWADKISGELRDALQATLSLTEGEKEFIRKIREEGKISANLLSKDKELINKIESHPAILWALKKQSGEHVRQG
jgi:predicted nucleotidyltransferase component of viral defense system